MLIKILDDNKGALHYADKILRSNVMMLCYFSSCAGSVCMCGCGCSV